MENNILKIYPMNLVMAVFKDQDQAMQVNLGAVEEVLATLEDRERKVLGLRFKEKKTLRECGQIVELTPERVRQIEAKALRKLRIPVRAYRLLSISKAEHMEIVRQKDKEYERLALDYENLKRVYEMDVNKKVVPEMMTGLAKKAELLEKPIEDLELSVRAYNCLKRKGKNKVKDITDMTLTELSELRNLGKKSLYEVIGVLEEHDLELREED